MNRIYTLSEALLLTLAMESIFGVPVTKTSSRGRNYIQTKVIEIVLTQGTVFLSGEIDVPRLANGLD